jgi:hypothetical protein
MAIAQPNALVRFGFHRGLAGAVTIRYARLVLGIVYPCAALSLFLKVYFHHPRYRGELLHGGSKSCVSDDECTVYTDCNRCGQCFSIQPNFSVECMGLCEVPRTAPCECKNGLCTRKADTASVSSSSEF